MKEKQKILIIKTGYSEVLDYDTNSRKVSLGDILRTTPLLHLYKKNQVTWLTDPYAKPLLEKNPYIDRLIELDWLNIEQLKGEEFDSLINLEKNSAICAIANRINAWDKKGFRLHKRTGKAEAYDNASEVLAVSSNPKMKKSNKKTAQELLFELVGEKWSGEKYVLGYTPKKIGNWDIGLNTQVGEKWPTKSWKKKNWDILEKTLLEEGYTVTRQDKQNENITKNLYGYMDWINSCEKIITNDSLGLHLAIVLEKKVLGLFGPTPSKEICFYGLGKAIIPDEELACAPCFSPRCNLYNLSCINLIKPSRILREIKNENYLD